MINNSIKSELLTLG